MKTNKTILSMIVSVFLASGNFIFSQNVAINTTGSVPDGSAMLDISSSSKGVLIPRVALQSTSDSVTIPSPATSVIVYNTNSAISGANADGVGYYFNAGTPAAVSWVKLVQYSIRWDDLRVTLDRGTVPAQIDYLSGTSGPQIWYFRGNDILEAMSFTVQLPHTWKEGTTIYPHLHWLPKSTTTGNVEWNFEYSWVNYDPTTPQVFPAITTSTVVANGPFTAKTHLITPLTTGNVGIDGTGKKISSILVCRIWRNSVNANDTYNADAGVLFLDFHIQIDASGSTSPFVK